MGSTPASEDTPNSGVALFMVIAAISVLSVLATEFTYIAQVNQKMAFDSLDQVKAHYLAKSGLKLSLLRLKAYAQIKALVANLSGGGQTGAPAGAIPGVPKQLLEQIWSFPFFYPIPTNIPNIGIADKEAIEDFTKNSGLDGTFSAKISSESAKYNLNRLLAGYDVQPSSSPNPSGSPSVAPANPTGGASASPVPAQGNNPSGTPSFSPDAARKNLQDFLAQVLQNKFDSDADFQTEYRDFRMDDLMDGITAWADHTYQRKLPVQDDWATAKQAPFNTISELHMIPPMTDDLYDLFAPQLTVATTPGIDIDTMEKDTLKALVPQITDEESAKFFTYRDSTDEDNLFKTEDDFYKYLMPNVAYFHNSQAMIDQFKTDLTNKGIRLVTEETQFKITIQAQVNQSVQLLEAWVTLNGTGTGSPNSPNTPGAPAANGQPNAKNTPPPAPATGDVGADGQPKPDSGLKVTFMRIL